MLAASHAAQLSVMCQVARALGRPFTRSCATHSPVPAPHTRHTPTPARPPAQRLRELDIEIFEEDEGAGKDYGRIGEGDVVIFPAFGATVQEMQLFKDKGVKMVDTTCPWVAKVRAGCRAGRGRGGADVQGGCLPLDLAWPAAVLCVEAECAGPDAAAAVQEQCSTTTTSRPSV